MKSQETDFLLGLDLGQAQDYTALVILERFRENHPATYHLRHIKRFKLGTPYPDIVDQVKSLLSDRRLGERKTLIVDSTGVGKAVMDLLARAELPSILVGVSITGGSAVAEDSPRRFNVAKKELVSALQVLFQTNRLKLAKGLEGIETLKGELLNFKAKITQAGNETFEAWREKEHDDLVLATALACWYGEFRPPPGRGLIGKAPMGNEALAGFGGDSLSGYGGWRGQRC